MAEKQWLQSGKPPSESSSSSSSSSSSTSSSSSSSSSSSTPPPSSPPKKKPKLQEEAEEESLETSELLGPDVEEPQPGTSSMGRHDESLEKSSQMIMGRKTISEGDPLVGEHAHYQEISLIGDGAYGTVYKAKDLSSGQVVALKKVRVPLTEDGLPSSTLREIAGLKQLDRYEHPHIVRLLDVCQGNYLDLSSSGGTSSEENIERINRGLILWLVFEHVDRDLSSFISTCLQEGMTPDLLPLIKQMSKEVLLGVDFLHSHRIIHRDLKPQNLLVTKEGRIKIADFGLAKTYDFEMTLTSVVVTLWYRAPEVLLGCPYATPVDLWSVGCIIAELHKLSPLFPGTSEGDQLDRIFRLIGTPSFNEWPRDVSLSWTAFPQRLPTPLRSVVPAINDDGLDLIYNLITFNPHIRLTAAQALKHKFFNN